MLRDIRCVLLDCIFKFILKLDWYALDFQTKSDAYVTLDYLCEMQGVRAALLAAALLFSFFWGKSQSGFLVTRLKNKWKESKVTDGLNEIWTMISNGSQDSWLMSSLLKITCLIWNMKAASWSPWKWKWNEVRWRMVLLSQAPHGDLEGGWDICLTRRDCTRV